MGSLGRWGAFADGYKNYGFWFPEFCIVGLFGGPNPNLIYPYWRDLHHITLFVKLHLFLNLFEDTTLYVKFESLNKYDTNLLFLTTTTWTFPPTLAIAIEY